VLLKEMAADEHARLMRNLLAREIRLFASPAHTETAPRGSPARKAWQDRLRAFLRAGAVQGSDSNDSSASEVDSDMYPKDAKRQRKVMRQRVQRRDRNCSRITGFEHGKPGIHKGALTKCENAHFLAVSKRNRTDSRGVEFVPQGISSIFDPRNGVFLEAELNYALQTGHVWIGADGLVCFSDALLGRSPTWRDFYEGRILTAEGKAWDRRLLSPAPACSADDPTEATIFQPHRILAADLRASGKQPLLKQKKFKEGDYELIDGLLLPRRQQQQQVAAASSSAAAMD